MNCLSVETRSHVVRCLVDGVSIRATVRITGVAKGTICKLLVDLGTACAEYHNTHVRNLRVRRLQCDEIWSFIGAKAKNTSPAKKQEGWGDVWTWTAIDADKKLCVSYLGGGRDAGWAHEFMDDCAGRVRGRLQLTTDGHKSYLDAVEDAFGTDVDYAMLVKTYESTQEETRYSPAKCVACESKRIMGNPDPKHISTSYVESQNWTVRTNMRRYTRLSNGFSRKIENHWAAVALNYFAYNFIKIHGTLRVTPAMAAGVTDRLFDVSDLVVLLEEHESGRAA